MEIQAITRYLTAELVEAAYRRGVFPMGDPTLDLITWHKPAERAIIPLHGFHYPRSLKKTLRKGLFQVTFDKDFAGVMQGCADRERTWITPDFHRVYNELNQRGKAHSVEVWHEGKLAGGLYGVHLGAAFFAESKFHYVTDASKVALASIVEHLKEKDFKLLEVQYVTNHLSRFGAIGIPNKQYEKELNAALKLERKF